MFLHLPHDSNPVALLVTVEGEGTVETEQVSLQQSKEPAMHLRNGCIRKATSRHQEVVRKASMVGNENVWDGKTRLVSVVPHPRRKGDKPYAGR